MVTALEAFRAKKQEIEQQAVQRRQAADSFKGRASKTGQSLRLAINPILEEVDDCSVVGHYDDLGAITCWSIHSGLVMIRVVAFYDENGEWISVIVGTRDGARSRPFRFPMQYTEEAAEWIGQQIAVYVATPNAPMPVEEQEEGVRLVQGAAKPTKKKIARRKPAAAKPLAGSSAGK